MATELKLMGPYVQLLTAGRPNKWQAEKMCLEPVSTNLLSRRCLVGVQKLSERFSTIGKQKNVRGTLCQNLDTRIKGSVDTRIKGSEDTRIKGSVDTTIKGSVVTTIKGSVYTRIKGSVDTRFKGIVDSPPL